MPTSVDHAPDLSVYFFLSPSPLLKPLIHQHKLSSYLNYLLNEGVGLSPIGELKIQAYCML